MLPHQRYARSSVERSFFLILLLTTAALLIGLVAVLLIQNGVLLSGPPRAVKSEHAHDYRLPPGRTYDECGHAVFSWEVYGHDTHADRQGNLPGILVINLKNGDRRQACLRGMVLLPGEYDVRNERPELDLKFSPKSFTITGRPRTSVRISIRLSGQVDITWLINAIDLAPRERVQAVGKKLRELNPAFDGRVNSGLENGDLEFATDYVTDYSPLEAIDAVNRLRVEGSEPGKGRLTDLRLLKTTFSFLECRNNPNLEALTGLQHQPLYHLACDNTKVANLLPLKNLSVSWLSCRACPVKDLRPLVKLPLSYLDIRNTQVEDLSPLQEAPLRILKLDNIPADDLSALENLKLEEVSFTPETTRGWDSLRRMPTLKTINGRPAAEFWEK